MSDSNTLDRKALDRLQRLGGEKLIRDMIDLFLDYAPKRLAAALAAEQATDLHALSQAVHPLKSSAGNVGARCMQDLAAKIEKLALDGEGAAIPPLLRELEAAFIQIKPHLERERKELAA